MQTGLQERSGPAPSLWQMTPVRPGANSGVLTRDRGATERWLLALFGLGLAAAHLLKDVIPMEPDAAFKGADINTNYGNVLSFRFSICKAETSISSRTTTVDTRALDVLATVLQRLTLQRESPDPKIKIVQQNHQITKHQLIIHTCTQTCTSDGILKLR